MARVAPVTATRRIIGHRPSTSIQCVTDSANRCTPSFGSPNTNSTAETRKEELQCGGWDTE
eukprot:3198391-Prymnesium_polylepis.1